MNGRRSVRLPRLPIVVEMIGTALVALGAVVLFTPDLAGGVLPAGVVTPAVGATAVAVGLLLDVLGTWQLIAAIRRQASGRDSR